MALPRRAPPRARSSTARARRAGRAARAPDVRWDALAGRADARGGRGGRGPRARRGSRPAASAVLGLRRDGDRADAHARPRRSTRPRSRSTSRASPPRRARGAASSRRSAGSAASPRELALRTRDGRRRPLEEYTARLDLRDPANRALAERAAATGRRRAATCARSRRGSRPHGIVERDGYAVTSERRGFSVAGRLGVALGLAHERITAERRLVDAVAWVRGGPPQRRFDCLGV